MGLLGILVGLGLLIWLAFRGWSVLLLAPIAALVAALFGSQPLLASWTQIFMGSAATFVARRGRLLFAPSRARRARAPQRQGPPRARPPR